MKIVRIVGGFGDDYDGYGIFFLGMLVRLKENAEKSKEARIK